jgi:membrane protease YdiL (CAAX protease family)
MKAFLQLLKRHLWAAFFLHQLIIFALAVGFLTAVRNVTGRNIHLGREPIGLIDGIGLIALSVAVIYLTNLFYLWLRGKDAPSLGIAFSPRRFLDLIIGLSVGLTFAIIPWINALLQNTAVITDRIDYHFDKFSIARIFTVAFLLLFVQGVMEETANRAFPMRIWENRPLLFRLLIPAVFFALIHLAGEHFGFERFAVLIMAGIIQGIAYALTGNIWFASGLHTAANAASFSITGLWHAGAIVSVSGYSEIPNWSITLLFLILLSLTLILKQKYMSHHNEAARGER